MPVSSSSSPPSAGSQVSRSPGLVEVQRAERLHWVLDELADALADREQAAVDVLGRVGDESLERVADRGLVIAAGDALEVLGGVHEEPSTSGRQAGP